MKDYSNIDSVLQGAQMAMQAAGIKDKREQDTLMQKFREHQMSMDVQAGERAEMQAKINEMNAKTQREMFELNAEKSEWERAQAEAETMSKQLEEVRQSILRPSLADEMSKTNPDTKILTELLLALDKTPGGPTDIAKSFLGVGQTSGSKTLNEKASSIQSAYPGMDYKTAMGIAAGTIKTVTDPITGNTSIVDIGKNKMYPLDDNSIKTETENINTGQITIWDLSSKSTGPWSGALEKGSILTGAVGLPVAKETIQARQFVRGAQNDLIRSLSVNRRFPVSEMNRIRDEIKVEPSFFDNPSMLRNRLIAIDSYLRIRLQKEIKASENTNLPKLDRQDALSAAKDIGNFITLMGVPQEKKEQSLLTQDEIDLIKRNKSKK